MVWLGKGAVTPPPRTVQPPQHLRSVPGRQVDEGVWTSPSNLSQSPKKVAPETDFSKGLDLEMPTSPPVNLHHLTAATETLAMPSFGHSPPQTQTHPSKSNNPSRAPEMVPAKTQTGPETPSKKSADKAVSVEVRACGGFLSWGGVWGPLLEGLSLCLPAKTGDRNWLHPPPCWVCGHWGVCRVGTPRRRSLGSIPNFTPRGVRLGDGGQRWPPLPTPPGLDSRLGGGMVASRAAGHLLPARAGEAAAWLGAAAGSACRPQAAERDWEEKRAALTQYSAKDINRLLEETQAELMKAIPDLEFAAKHKQATGSGSTASTPEHKPSKPQHAPKSGGKGDPNGRRGSGTVRGRLGSTSGSRDPACPLAVPSPVGLPGLSRLLPRREVYAWEGSGRASGCCIRGAGKGLVPSQHRLCPDELTVPRYRTEKPSKSPPPPPPRRSFPSSHGLTTTRSGEVIVTSKKEPGFMKVGSGAVGWLLGWTEPVTVGKTSPGSWCPPPLTALLPSCRRPSRRSWRPRSPR